MPSESAATSSASRTCARSGPPLTRGDYVSRPTGVRGPRLRPSDHSCRLLDDPPEAEHRRRPERLAGAEHGRWERRMVGRVREVLGLESDAVASTVRAAAHADERAVEERAGVELQPRLGGQHLERSSACRLQHMGCERERVVASVDDEVVVVAAAARTDRRRDAEVQRRAVDGTDLAGRNEGRVDGRERGGIQRQHVPFDRAASFAGEVPAVWFVRFTTVGAEVAAW